jgi:nucleoside phosphorylase
VDPGLLGAVRNFTDKGWIYLVQEKRPVKGKPTRKVGCIATGDKVIAFAELLEKHRRDWPKLIGVEMEAGGVASACFQAVTKPGFFMIRCASDLADANKDSVTVSKWRSYACDVAAAYAVGLLQSGPIVSKASE